jgi:hypothetical protein
MRVSLPFSFLLLTFLSTCSAQEGVAKTSVTGKESVPLESEEVDYTFYDSLPSIISKKRDTLTLSTAYFENLYTNRQLIIFPLEILRLGVRAEDFFHMGTSLGTFLWRLGEFWVNFCLSTDYHETGHGLRAKAFGYDYAMHVEAGKGNSPPNNKNFFMFFIYALFPFRNPVSATSFEKYSRTYKTIDGTRVEKEGRREDAVISAGGINNNVYCAERLSEEIYERGTLSFAEGSVYFLSALYGPIYRGLEKMGMEGGDPVQVGECWKDTGIPATKVDIGKGALIATALSSTTYYMLYTTWCSLWGQQPGRPFSIGGFRVPDVFSYIMSKGVSYRVVSAYALREDMQFLFGIEWISSGLFAMELHAGAKGSFGDEGHKVGYKLVFTCGEGFDVEGNMDFSLFEHISVGFGGGLYARKSLLGERHAQDLRKEYSSDVFLSISFRY